MNNVTFELTGIFATSIFEVGNYIHITWVQISSRNRMNVFKLAKAVKIN